MERLYTPWRMEYITSEKKCTGCVFCTALAEDKDRENFLIYRGETTFTIMNIYPYNTGHLMILPHEHKATLSELPPQAQREMIELAAYFTDLLTQLMNPDGFNVGFNIGQASGAGIGSHLHMHIVPRWNGDSNFMPVIGSTRILPEEVGDTYDKIVTALAKQPPKLDPSS